MIVTIAVCTRDRADQLRETLEAMTRLQVPAQLDWELIVVDNGSTDATPDVARRFAQRLPLLLVHEPRGGLSIARNRAVDAVRGDYIVWTDDDVTVDPGWLAGYVAAFSRWPEAAVFGGPIELKLLGTPPSWLLAALSRVGGAFAQRDLGAEPAPLVCEGHRIPFGANFAVRMAEQRRHRYAPALGRRPGAATSVAEEVAVIEAILGEGGTGWWVPGARVTHRIPAERQTMRYLRRFYAGAGEAAVHRGHDIPPRWRLWLTVAKAEIRFALSRPLGRPERWIEHVIMASVARGQLRAAAPPAARSRGGPSPSA